MSEGGAKSERPVSVFLKDKLAKLIPSKFRRSRPTDDPTKLPKTSLESTQPDIPGVAQLQDSVDNTSLPDDMKKKVDILMQDMGVVLNPNSENPFDQADLLLLRKESFLGKEKRIPTWDDLLKMVSSAEKDDFEYGLVITKDSESEDPIIEYLRGERRNIKNATAQKGQGVFSHAHPALNMVQEPFSTLVSPGDMHAQYWANYGGGYLNVVSLGGVTMHLGRSNNSEDLSNDFAPSKLPHYVHRIETGQFTGQLIIRMDNGSRGRVLEDLYKSGLPYVFTIIDNALKHQSYFLYIPWKQLDRSIDLYDITHGEGLPKILKTVNVDISLPANKNLYEALLSP